MDRAQPVHQIAERKHIMQEEQLPAVQVAHWHLTDFQRATRLLRAGIHPQMVRALITALAALIRIRQFGGRPRPRRCSQNGLVLQIII